MLTFFHWAYWVWDWNGSVAPKQFWPSSTNYASNSINPKILLRKFWFKKIMLGVMGWLIPVLCQACGTPCKKVTSSIRLLFYLDPLQNSAIVHIFTARNMTSQLHCFVWGLSEKKADVYYFTFKRKQFQRLSKVIYFG